MELILAFFVLAVVVALFKKVWPLLLLAAIGYCIYLWPIPSISVLTVLAVLGFFGNKAEKKSREKIISIVEEANIIELNDAVELSGKSRSDATKIMDDLVDKGIIMKDVVKDKVLYKSKNYQQSSNVQEINLD